MSRPLVMAVVGVVVLAAASYGISRWQFAGAQADGKAKADSAAAANAPMRAEQARRDTLERLLATVMGRAEQMPNDSMLVISTANIAYNLERYDVAERFYRRFLDSVDPSNVNVQIDYAYSVFMNGRMKDAVAVLDGILKRTPKHQAAMYNLGILYLRSNDTERGLQWMRKCRDADTSSDVGKRAAELVTTLERTS
ncbi:MAG: tetratricopeptide repeat protein [Candidatus Kapabacteria bacterium]|nr:tetratricopeptide repeat protein [Candidatus Kapabacteria bacterium]